MKIIEEAKSLAEQYEDEHDRFGLRIVPEGHEVEVGDILNPSYVWDDGEKTEEELPGTSALDLLDKTAKLISRYIGNQIVLIGGDFEEYGEDDGEIILSNAEVLKVWDLRDPKMGD